MPNITTGDRIAQAYVCIFDVLDRKGSKQEQNEWLSEAMRELSWAYHELTGQKIGHAVGWDKVKADA